MMPQIQNIMDSNDRAKQELYRLIGEGYEAMQEGRVNTIDEVKKNLEKRREQLG